MKTKLITLLTLLLTVCSGAWGVSYIPTTTKTISSNTLFLVKDLTTSETWWKYANGGSTTDKKPDPSVWDSDFGTQPTSNQKTYQVKNDGGVFNSNKRVVHMLVTGITGVKVIGQANSGRGFQIGATEYISGTTNENTSMSVVAGSNSANNPLSYSGLDASKTYIISIFAYNSDVYLYGIYFTVPSTPTITTQPQSASYVTGNPISALTVEATGTGTLTYQWYSCDDAQKTNAAAIDGATSASYTPTAAGFYYVTVTDDNGSIDSDVAEITVSAAEAPSFTSVTPSSTSVVRGVASTITAVVAGVPTPTIQWYSNTTASNEGGSAIDGATDLTLDLANTAVGTFYYYAVATNTTSQENNVASAVQTITVLPQAPTLTAGGYFATANKSVTIAKADGEDVAATISYKIGDGEWTDYTEALSITETSTVYAKVVQDGLESSEVSATYTKFSKSDLVSVSDAKTWTIPTSLTLELKNDGTTTPAKYDEYYTYADIATINNHNLGSFDGTTLAFSGQYPYRGNNGSQNGNLQFITTVPGKVTIEFSNTGGSNKERWIKVNDTTGSEEASGTTKRTEDFTVSAGTVTITHVDKEGNLSNGLRIYSITFTPCETVKVAASGYTSLASVLDLDIANATTTTEGADALEAYVITDITKTAVTLTTVESAPAETGLILKGTANAEYTIPVSASPASITKNELSAAVEATNVGAENAYVVSGGQLMLYELAEIPAGKAYLLKSKVPTGARGLAFFFDDETTGISNVEDAQRQLLSGDFYNLAGQRVAQPAKGLYIVNGRKVVIR